MLLASLLLCSPLVCPSVDGPLLHIPHDPVASVACAPLPGGGMEIVTVAGQPIRALRSRDQGLTWTVIGGDGLERQNNRRVVWFPGAARPSFLIGTDSGVWAYEPLTGVVQRRSDGIAAADLDVLDLVAPRQGSDGPALLASRSGAVYRLDPGTSAWRLIFNLGSTTAPGGTALALSPDFDPQAAPGRRRTIVVGMAGMLLLSRDGGANWLLHPQFAQSPQPLTEWQISSLALAEDFRFSGSLVVGRARNRSASSGPVLGDLWRSGDGGQSFQMAFDLTTPVTAVAATPPGPSGRRFFLAAGYTFPNYGGYQGTGVLRSEDGGLTWDDFGNEQDFLIEGDGVERHTAVPRDRRVDQQFAVSPHFATDGSVFYGRSEGLWRTWDEGHSWIPERLRPEEEVRDLAVTKDAAGNLLVFAGCYGSGVIEHDITNGATKLLVDREPRAFLRSMASSPRFAEDGTVIAGAAQELAFWYDPALAAANPFGASGWFLPPLRDTVTGARDPGYPRAVALSPNYDSRGLPGTDLHFYWSPWDSNPMRSLDGGFTAERLDGVIGGGTPPFFRSLAIAPTYDGSSAAGRTDVFGGSHNALYRLEDDVWREVLFVGSNIDAIAVDPGFSRPGNPRLFLGIQGPASVLEFIDDPLTPTVSSLRRGLPEVRVLDVEVPPDFAARPVLYCLSYGSGVYRLDLSVPTSQWRPVGGAWPGAWTDGSLGFSPDFAQDRTIFVSTQLGVLVGQDLPGAPWVVQTDRSYRDDFDPTFRTYAPKDPRNPDPTRVWPWATLTATQANQISGLTVTGRSILKTSHDGSYLIARGYARQLRLQTVAAPQAGQVLLSATDFWTGAALGAVQEDLAQPGAPAIREVTLDLGAVHAVEFRVEALLDRGETFVFDGISLVR